MNGNCQEEDEICNSRERKNRKNIFYRIYSDQLGTEMINIEFERIKKMIQIFYSLILI